MSHSIIYDVIAAPPVLPGGPKNTSNSDPETTSSLTAVGALGSCFGISFFSTQAMVVHVQPLHLTGRVAGIELFLSNNCRGVALLVTYMLWNFGLRHLWFLYTQAVVAAVILLSIIMSAVAQIVVKDIDGSVSPLS